MGIVSYAQNFEDVMLWRALGHIERGFYLDIGAQHPVVDSVSKVFYEHGWHGVHVEPIPYYAELLRQQRPSDKVIQAAVGKGPAKLPVFEIPDTGISTADPVIAQQHRERGFDVHEITVPCIALSAVFKACAGSEIHWLKIDVEGFEKQVLSSWGKSVARPWIVVVESTLPLTQIETHESWESILIGYGYTPVYFDGLNRYYISDAHPELKNAFLAPPNVFDGFTLNGTASASFHHLIDARHKEKISEILAQNEQQKQSATNEIECLALSLASLDKTHAEQEQKRAQREQEVAAQLLAIQQHAAQEMAEQALSHSEQERALQRQYAEREQTLAQQLQAGQQEQQERAQREKEHAEQTSEIRQELEALLRTQAQREREVAAQLLAIQQQAAQEMAEQALSHSEQERTLQRQHAEREQTLAQQLQAGQQEQQDRAQREQVLSEQTSLARQELEALLRTQAQREQAVAAQLLAIQQQATQEKAEQARSHSEQARALQRQHTEREQILTQQLQAGQQELRRLEQNRAQREKALENEIATLQSETLALHHAQQLQAQQHSLEISTKQDEHNLLIQSSSALQANLKAQIQAELQTSLRLRQALIEVQQSLKVTHASLTWRMTAPFRRVASLFSPERKQFTAPEFKVEAESHQEIKLTATELPPINTPSLSPIMQMTNSSQITVATTLDELLAYHDQQFVRTAYQTLLGRTPDPEGLSYYLGRLRIGYSKLQIVTQLRLSKESNARAVNLPGLDTAMQRYQRGQYPLVGWLFRLLEGTESNHPTERNLRAIERQINRLDHELGSITQQLARLEPESTRRLANPEQAVGALQASINSLSVNTGGERDQPEPLPPPLASPEPDLSGLSIVAQRIFTGLSQAVIRSKERRVI
jgi:FkbM family methyltransferase